MIVKAELAGTGRAVVKKRPLVVAGAFRDLQVGWQAVQQLVRAPHAPREVTHDPQDGE